MGIRWMCACGTSSPRTTTATLEQAISRSIFFATFFGEYRHGCERLVLEVEKVVHLLLRNDQRMSPLQRIDVQKCKETVVLGDLVARNLTGYDA